jgi:hypothetical protein
MLYNTEVKDLIEVKDLMREGCVEQVSSAVTLQACVRDTHGSNIGQLQPIDGIFLVSRVAAEEY